VTIIHGLGPALPSLMNTTSTGGKTIWGNPMVLNAQDASWISNYFHIHEYTTNSK